MLRKKKAKSEYSALQRLGLFFHRSKETTIVYWMAIVLFGIVSYAFLLPRQGFPNVSAPFSVISGTYVVGDKEKVDKDVVQPLSEIVLKTENVKRLNTEANDNFFVAVIEHDGAIDSNLASQKIKENIEKSSAIPKSVTLEYRAIDAGRFEEQSDLLVAVYSKNPKTAADLSDAADKASKTFTDATGIKDASTIRQFETGVNPSTGETVTLQTGYDIVGTKDGIGQIHIHRSSLIGVRADVDADAFDVFNGAKTAIDSLKSDPSLQGYEFLIVADFAESIDSQISSLQRSLLEGLIVVIAVSFLLISWRAGVVTALSMITVLLATVGLLFATGTSLNTITLFALILSLGLIVDDTTIMVEAIDAAKNKHQSQSKVVSEAIKKVARASFAGTLTTMLGFAPMLFIGGILGDFIRILPITIILALAMSLLISLTLVPFFARFLLRGSKERETIVGRIEKAVSSKLARILQRMKGSLSRKVYTSAIALGLSVVFIGASFIYFSRLKFDIFPTTKDTDGISVNVTMPQGASIEQAESKMNEVVKETADVLGSNFRRLSLQATGSQNGGTAIFDLISFKEREKTSPQLVAEVESAVEDVEGAIVRVSQIDVGPPKDAFPFTVKIFSDNNESAVRLAEDISKYLQNREIERLNGTTFTVTRTEVRTDSIKRDDGKKYVDVGAGFSATDVSALVTATQRDVEAEFDSAKLTEYGLPKESLVFDFGNESDNQESFGTMLIAFPVLLITMYLLLAFQFKSLLQPILIFTAIPYSFFGVAAGLYYTNNPLSFFVMIGFFALIGIAVNNTILLTDFANQARAQGARPIDAIATAVRERFRPLLATSLTSVVALVPLAVSDPFWESLAYTLIFGLLSSTFLVVVSFPYAYLVAEWIRLKVSRKKR